MEIYFTTETWFITVTQRKDTDVMLCCIIEIFSMIQIKFCIKFASGCWQLTWLGAFHVVCASWIQSRWPRLQAWGWGGSQGVPQSVRNRGIRQGSTKVLFFLSSVNCSFLFWNYSWINVILMNRRPLEMIIDDNRIPPSKGQHLNL